MTAALLLCAVLALAQTRSLGINQRKASLDESAELYGAALLNDIANDSLVVAQMKHYSGIPISLAHKPYLCFIGTEYSIMFRFCPECVWVVDSCSSERFYSRLTISESSGYAFHLENVLAADEWNPGDTIQYVFFMPCAPEEKPEWCILIPVVSRVWTAAYTIDPVAPKTRKILKK